MQAVTVRFTVEERQELDRLRGSVSRSEWLRLAGLKRPAQPPAPVVPELNQVAWADLARGPMSNLHQLVKHLNDVELLQPGSAARDLAQRFGEVIDLAHSLRDGLIFSGARA